MLTLVIIYITLSSAAVPIMPKLLAKYPSKAAQITFGFAGLLMILGILVLIFPQNIQKSEVVGEAELIAQYSDASLYYDEDKDEYFAVINDDWNPLCLYQRIELNQEEAAAKAAAHALEQLPLIGKKEG